MKARPEFRDRPAVEVAVLDALVDRNEDGMTVFELRSHAEVSIHDLEDALESLKADGLIEVEESGNRTVIRADERVIPETTADTDETSFFEELRERLPF
ncbi:DUF6432 family protein [Natranaeroarchaeum sulfidigenes]|uniref:Transcriptional regulator, contains HTH domain n=1 Tax=Natranaeroarchaeum sulfidigenes TaxID=2784880 RepID=A0A897MUP5_9EURY|nr:DUF6432 family protein [Natranaeroarchaeum sulfidigenes]QSG04197.1 Transcriptional regulator, contains HTH domain [Natranaeroarchaeum sulfidigenes]